MNGVEFYDRFAERYDRFYSGPGVKAEDRAWLRVLLDEVGEDLFVKGRVVDLGCGTGALLDYVADGDRYLGIDAAPRMVCEAAKKHPEAKFMVADLDRRINLGRKFDLAVCNFAFNYFQRPAAALWNIHRMLEPGGLLFLTLMRPKQILMPGCSHRFNWGLTRFYPAKYFDCGLFTVLGSGRFGVTSKWADRWPDQRLAGLLPFLAGFEVVLCERT